MPDTDQDIVTALLSALNLTPTVRFASHLKELRHNFSIFLLISFTQSVPILRLLPTKANKILNKNVAFAKEFVRRLMEEKRKKMETDKGKEDMKKDFVGRLFLEADSSKPLSEYDVAGLISTVIFAGMIVRKLFLYTIT